MSKLQLHRYVYPSDDDVSEGHIRIASHDTYLCGIERILPINKTRELKRYIEERPLCTKCEGIFRKILVTQSGLIDKW